jgi:hypothetical protein
LAGRWLMVDAHLFREKNIVDWLVMGVDLF